MSAEVFLHRNGAGRIVGSSSAVGDDCRVDRESLIEGRTRVSYGSVVTASSIKDSTISASNLNKSILIRSDVAGAIIMDSGLEDAVVRGTKARLAVVRNCLLGNQVVVEGCAITGLEINGPFFLHTNWHRAPRHLLLQPAPGVQMGISECAQGRMHCGCECRPATEWIQKKELLRKIFVRRGWTSESIDQISELFEEWRRVRLAA